MTTVADLEKRIDRHDERLDSIESSQNGMNEKMVRLDEKMNSSNNEMKRMNDKLTEVAADIKQIVMKPGKRWDSMTSDIVKIILGLVVGFMFQHFI